MLFDSNTMLTIGDMRFGSSENFAGSEEGKAQQTVCTLESIQPHLCANELIKSSSNHKIATEDRFDIKPGISVPLSTPIIPSDVGYMSDTQRKSVIDGLLYEIYDRWQFSRQDSCESDTFDTEYSSTTEHGILNAQHDLGDFDLEQNEVSRFTRSYLDGKGMFYLVLSHLCVFIEHG